MVFLPSIIGHTKLPVSSRWIYDIFGFLKFLSRKAIIIKTMDLKIDFGYSDAAATGLMTGILNGSVYNILAVIFNYIKVYKWNVDIIPDFNSDKFDVTFCCISRIKTVHIIAVVIKAFKMFIKIRNVKKKGRIGYGTSD